jgi:hypothetical protein
MHKFASARRECFSKRPRVDVPNCWARASVRSRGWRVPMCGFCVVVYVVFRSVWSDLLLPARRKLLRVCVRVCMHVCKCAWTDLVSAILFYLPGELCVCVCMYICTYICMWVCGMYILCMYKCMICMYDLHVCTYTCEMSTIFTRHVRSNVLINHQKSCCVSVKDLSEDKHDTGVLRQQ